MFPNGAMIKVRIININESMLLQYIFILSKPCHGTNFATKINYFNITVSIGFYLIFLSKSKNNNNSEMPIY